MALIQQVKDGKFIDETTGTGSTSTACTGSLIYKFSIFYLLN